MSSAELEEEAALNLRKRSTLRLLTELFLCGLTSDLKPLLGVLSDLIASDTRNEPDLSNTILHLLISWMRYANRPILALHSRKQREEYVAAALPAAITLPDYLTPQQREQVLNKLFMPYGRQINERLIDVHTSLQKLEKRAARIQMMRGEIPLDMQDQRKQLREQMSTLQAQVETYLDLLDSELAPLPAIQDAEDELFNLVSLASGDDDAIAAMGEAELGPWDDVETKHFYEQLLDLTIVVPPVLLQEGQEKEKARIRREKEKAAGAAGADGGDDGEEEEEKSSSGSAAPRSTKAALVDDAETWKPNWEMTIDELEAKLASMQARGTSGRSGGGGAGGAGANANPDREHDSLYEEDDNGNPIVPDSFIGKEKRSHPMELLLTSMAHSLNREGVDAIAEKFCYLNTKNNRMRLVEAMYTLPRTRVDEIPYWTRLLATLHAHMRGDMAEELVSLLTSEFYRLLRGRSQYRLESKIRNMRYLTELTKFKVAPPTLIFKVWHALLLSFNPNAIQLIALLLEQCGRWLYRTPLHHMRCAQFLERTMQLKETKYLDRTLNLLLENAYFAVRPPVSVSIQQPRKERTILHQFIRKTLFQDLNARNTDMILKRLRKLNWNETPAAAAAKAAAATAASAAASTAAATPSPVTSSAAPAASADGSASSSSSSAAVSVAAGDSTPAAPADATAAPAAVRPPPAYVTPRLLVIKCLSNVSSMSFGSIPALAMVCAGLDKYHQIGPVVVDNILEEVRVGLEMNRYSQNQRRLLVVRYLAELYIFKLVDSQLIFDTLYLLLTLGHEADEAGKLVSRIDPPSDTFRIRLVVTLLEIAGPFFDRGGLKFRLDRFLLYFQRYLFLKEIIPIDLQFAVSDLLDKLRPDLQRANNMEHIADQIRKVEANNTHATLDRLVSLTEGTGAPGADASPMEVQSEVAEEDEEEKEEDEADADEDAELAGDANADTSRRSYADKAAAGNSLIDAVIAAAAEADAVRDSDASDAGSDAGSSDSDEDEWERSDTRGVDARYAPRRAKEEDEFQAELDRMMADAVESAKFQPRTNNMATVEAATTAAGLSAATSASAAASAAGGSKSRPSPQVPGCTVDGEDGVQFRFLSRNNKRSTTQARALWVPADCDMAASTVANQASALAEKADLKRLVLKGLQRTEREQAEEDRLNQQQWASKDRKDGVVQDFSHRSHNPAERADRAAAAAEGRGLNRIGANFGAKTAAEKAREGDLGLKLESFAFASEETLTQSRVTLQGDSRRKK